MRTKVWICMMTCCLVGASAQAGTLTSATSATWVGDFQGTPFTLVTSGASLTASGSASGSSISSVYLTAAAPVLATLTNNLGAPVLVTQTLGVARSPRQPRRETTTSHVLGSARRATVAGES